MKSLVTGGAGFIGSNIVKALVEKGHEVTVLDDYSLGTDKNMSSVRGDIRIVKGDIRDSELVRQLTKGVDYIFHQAAASSTLLFLNDLRGALSTNIDGFLNVLMAAQESGVKRVIYASSATVYGNSAPPLKEHTKPAPGNFYAASKLSGEYLAIAFSKVYGLETVGLRYMGIYGIGEGNKGGAASVVTQFLLRMKRGEKPIIYEDGAQTRDFTYVKDVAQVNLLACECSERLLGEVFNVGTGKQTSFNELIRVINELLGTSITPEYIPVPYAGYQLHQMADITQISQRLGYKPRYNLEEGIREMLDSWEEHRPKHKGRH